MRRMMLGMPDRGTSPMRLLVLATGAGIVGISFLILPLPHLNTWLWRAFYLVPFVCCVAVSLFAEQRIGKNIKGNVWMEAELAPVRRLTESSAWQAALVVAFAVIFFIFLFPGFRFRGLMMLWPIQSMMRLSGIFRRAVKHQDGLMDLRDLKPIQSEHWGESAHD
ncbi:MAG: hypothetical protein ABI357_06125 [Granulicella sp.]